MSHSVVTSRITATEAGETIVEGIKFVLRLFAINERLTPSSSGRVIRKRSDLFPV
jgi:hypothetical protein